MSRWAQHTRIVRIADHVRAVGVAVIAVDVVVVVAVATMVVDAAAGDGGRA
jgi:hypothetical protein